MVVGWPGRERAILTEPCDRSEDQPRIERPQRRLVETRSGHDTRPQTLDEHVGGAEQITQNISTLRRSNVDGEHAFIGSLRHEASAEACIA